MSYCLRTRGIHYWYIVMSYWHRALGRTFLLHIYYIYIFRVVQCCLILLSWQHWVQDVLLHCDVILSRIGHRTYPVAILWYGAWGIHCRHIVMLYHYSDVIMGAMVSNHQPHHCFTQPLIQAQIKESIKAPRHWPLCGEFTGDRWIPRTNGQ